MEIVVNRIDYNENSTVGTIHINGEFNGFTLEDKKRPTKIKAITCIPSGRYKIVLRKKGTIHARYEQKYDFHEGMLHLLDVPNFQYIYIHIGNYPKDTMGCLLVGLQYCQGQEQITHSASAYAIIYKKILAAIEKGEEVWISVNDLFY
jgi:hypothetical protein